MIVNQADRAADLGEMDDIYNTQYAAAGYSSGVVSSDGGGTSQIWSRKPTPPKPYHAEKLDHTPIATSI